ncbi:MAG: hypothetical protein KJO07_20935, partial [Deltaproteobacteria bacterium]|nr:hypothetical protein [Deltaproteobacteria bacterium]
LSLVPATTPYIYAQLDSLPKEYIERTFLAQARAYQRVIDELAKIDDKDELYAEMELSTRLALALVDELDGKLSRAGLAEIGIDLEARFVLYGQGIYPVLRLELGSGEKLQAAIERMLVRMDVKVPRLSHRDTEMWHAGAELAPSGVDAVVVVEGNQLIAALTPIGDAQPAFLDQLLADEAPGKSLAETGTLARLAGRYGFSVGTIGFIDLERSAELFGAVFPGAEPACAAEMVELVSPTPRWVFGTREMSAERITARVVMETRRDVRDALERSRATVPSLSAGLSKRFPLAIGGGLDLQAFADFLTPTLRKLSSRRLQCSALSWVTDMAAELERSTVELARSPWKQFIGGHLLVSNVDLRNPDGPKADALAILASRDPQALLRALAESLPGLKGKSLASGQAPIEVALPGIASSLGSVFVAVGPRAVGLAIGKGVTTLRQQIASEPAAGMPIFVMHIDEAFMNELSGSFSPVADESDSGLAKALTDLEKSTAQSTYLEARVVGDGVRMDVEITTPALEK